jgi:ferredoxin-NADP reductase
VRVTVKALGDHSDSLTTLPVGTRVAIEGPYGAVTPHSRHSDKVLLIAAGVGVTPIRALLEGLPSVVDVVVLLRAPTPDEVVFHTEIAALVKDQGGELHVLVGSRQKVRLDARQISRLVPDIAERDVYVCGPEGFANRVASIVKRLGVNGDRVHRESFAF